MTYKTFFFKQLYFWLFAALGVIYPYVPVFLEALQFRKWQIGLLSMIPNIAAFAVSPLWTTICDTMNWYGQTLVLTMIGTVIATLAMLWGTSFTYQAITISIMSFFRSPTTALVDSLCISSSDDPAEYGPQRLWGAVSFGIFSFVGGFVTTHGPENAMRFEWNFYMMSVFYFLSGVAVLGIEITNKYDPKQKQNRKSSDDNIGGDMENTFDFESDGKVNDRSQDISPAVVASIGTPDTKARHNMCSSLYMIFKANPSIILFSVIIFLSGIGQGVIDAFLFIRLGQLGGSGIVMGIARAITCAAEVPVFHYGGQLQKRFGTWGMLAITQAAYVVRFMYYSVLREPWAVLPCEFLNGLTFAATWSVACNFANAISTDQTKSTMQALVEGIHFGLGAGLGSFLGGLIYDRFGAVKLFEIMTGVTALSGCLALVGWLVVTDVVEWKERKSAVEKHMYLDKLQCSSPDETDDDSAHGSSTDDLSMTNVDRKGSFSLFPLLFENRRKDGNSLRGRLAKLMTRSKSYEMIDSSVHSTVSEHVNSHKSISSFDIGSPMHVVSQSASISTGSGSGSGSEYGLHQNVTNETLESEPNHAEDE